MVGVVQDRCSTWVVLDFRVRMIGACLMDCIRPFACLLLLIQGGWWIAFE